MNLWHFYVCNHFLLPAQSTQAKKAVEWIYYFLCLLLLIKLCMLSIWLWATLILCYSQFPSPSDSPWSEDGCLLDRTFDTNKFSGVHFLRVSIRFYSRILWKSWEPPFIQECLDLMEWVHSEMIDTLDKMIIDWKEHNFVKNGLFSKTW